MSNGELTQSYIVPLKSCHNSVLEHNLVTISLQVRWGQRTGDDPSLVVEVTSKQPPISYLQQNQPSVHVNSIHHHYQHQQNFPPTFQQQHYQTSRMNPYDRLNSTTTANPTNDHNDVPSITTATTMVYNAFQPQYQPSVSSSDIENIERIKLDLRSPFLSPPNPSYLPIQQVIQAPPNNPNDAQLNMKTFTTNLTSAKKPKPPVTPLFSDPQQLSTITCPSSTSTPSPRRSLICTCPDPTKHHAHDCAANPLNNSETHTHFLFESAPGPSMNRMNTSLTASALPARIEGAICMPPTADPMVTTTYLFPNPSMYPVDSLPSMNVPQVMINHQPNCPSLILPRFEQQRRTSKPPRQPRKPSIKRKNATTPGQHLTDVQQTHSLTNHNSPTGQQNPPSLRSSPIQTPQEMFMLANNLPITENTSLDTTNDSKGPVTQQPVSPAKSNVRSPVEIVISESKTTNQTSPELDRTISMISRSKGEMPTHHSPPTLSQQRKKSLFSQLVDEPDGSIRTTRIETALLEQKQQSSTSASNPTTSPPQSLVYIMQQGVRPNPIEQNQVTLLRATNGLKKRAQLQSTNNPKSKRIITSKINTSKPTNISPSYQDLSQTKISSVTSTSNIDADLFLWSTDTPIEQLTSRSLDNSFPMPDVPQNNNMLDNQVSNTDSVRILYQNAQPHPIQLYEFGSPKVNQHFDPSTSAGLQSVLTSSTTSNQLMSSISIDNTSNRSRTPASNSSDIYAAFFPSESLPSSSQWDDNQVTTTVITPPDLQTNYLLELPSHSQTDSHLDPDSKSQAPTSSQNNSYSTRSMNDHDKIQTSSKRETKSAEKLSLPPSSNLRKNQSLKSPSKFSTQRNRPNPTKKQSSSNPTCTRCGCTHLIDITQHEFPKQKGLLFECASCGNNSIRSNVSVDEHKRRLAKVAADHLNKVECQFCHRQFHSHNDYIVHLRDDHESNKPILSLSVIVFMNLTVGQIVWARRQKEDIYWPGRITIISNNSNDFWATEFQSNYLVQFFVTNQSIWTTDILPYRQYRESMTNDSFMHYGLHPTIKQDFLNAVHQADYTNSNEMYSNDNDLTSMTTMKTPQQNSVPMIEDNTDNDFLLTPAPMFSTHTEYYNPSNRTIQPLEPLPPSIEKTSQTSTANTDWYTQQGLIVESITPPLPSQNDTQLEHISSSDHFHQINSVIIITTKTYSNSSFISYLFNCFSHFPHHSIIYIDDPVINYQHPTTSNISYLICLDHFDSTIKQALNSTVLNNLTAHITYLFLLLNAPSHELVKHFYSTVMDQRTIVVLHYHSTFENEALLLCSGSRTTYEMIRWTLLKYLCPQMKYIESEGDEQLYSAYCISSMIQCSNVLNHFVQEQIQETLNEKFDRNFLGNNQDIINELFPQLSITKPTTQSNLLDFVQQSNADLLQNRSKQSAIMTDLLENGAIRTQIRPPICEYYLEHVLHEE